ncbi:MAG: hypothetical protein U0326_35405 [Polyangiales bacterium]
MKLSPALIMGLTLAAGDAAAQLTAPVRVGGTTVDATHPLGGTDCRNRTQISFQVAYTSTTTFNDLEFWMGTDAMTCGTTTSRTATNGAATCWQITQATITGQQSTYTNSDLRIRANLLIDPVSGNCATLGTGRGTIATNYLSLLTTTASGVNMVGMGLSIPYDLDPPAAATGVAASPGEGALEVHWDSRTTSSTTDNDGGTTSTTATTDLAGFYLLCDPPIDAPADAGVSDGGVADGGLDVPDQTFGDDGGASSASCSGTFPSLDIYDSAVFNRYVRGSRTSASATVARASGLRDNTGYRCVVVAEDLAGNRSVSLPTQCVVPVPITDFWERYRASGGAAQPISCAATAGSRRDSLAALAALATFAAASLSRRRRRTS